jgi:hypothetical protein
MLAAVTIWSRQGDARVLFFAMRKLAAQPAGRPSTIAALSASAGIALAGAIIWGLVARLFEVQLSLIGVLIGAGVGYAVGRFRPGHRPTIVAGAIIAVAGCALGTFLAIVFTLLAAGVSLGQIFAHLGIVLQGYPGDVGALGFVFWAIAAFAAVRVPLQGQRLAARTAAAGPGGYGQPAGYGQPGANDLPAGYGQAGANGQGQPGATAYGQGEQTGNSSDGGLPPFTGPAGPLPPGIGPA